MLYRVLNVFKILRLFECCFEGCFEFVLSVFRVV